MNKFGRHGRGPKSWEKAKNKGAALMSKRLKLGLTLTQAAEAVNCSVTHIMDLENGTRHPDAPAGERYEEFLKKSAARVN